MPCVKPNEQLSAVPCPMEKFWLEVQTTVLGSGTLMLSQAALSALQSLAAQINISRAAYEAGLTAWAFLYPMDSGLTGQQPGASLIEPPRLM